MFPPSLHKNIRELDKQITLLESECENMEAEERKRGMNAKMYFLKSKESVNSLKKGDIRGHVERPFVTGPRIPDPKRIKPLSVGNTCPKSSAKSSRKISTVRETSTTTSDEPKCNKKYVSTCPLCGRKSDQGNKNEKIQGVTTCICGKELLNEYNKKLDVYGSDKPNGSDNEKQVLHKGILHANPGGTIEVTVTQKTSKIPNNMNQNKQTSSGRIREKDKSEPCITKEKSLGKLKLTEAECQKWAQILYEESVCLADEKTNLYKVKNCDVKNGCNQQNNPDVMPEKGIAPEEYNNENECPDAAVSSVPKKPSQKSPFQSKNLENVIDASPRTERSSEEKNIQCTNEEVEKPQELIDPMRILIALVNAIKGKFNEEETKKILNELDVSLDKLNEDKMNDEYRHCCQDSNYVMRLQKHFLNKKKLSEKLMKEKAKLSEDLAVRDQLLSNLNAKEKEYLSIITNLKVSLEKTKAHAEDNIEILKELNMTKNKLINEARVADALRKSHAKMQEQVQKCMLENDKLKTEVRLIKLESQKFCVLLAGKDAEIKRYKDEVELIQRQITDQLAILRSNKAANEVQKAMEAIIQQSQVFSATDLDSAFSEGRMEEKIIMRKSKQRDKLVHSSPTSTKSSLPSSSWNQISSIRADESKVNIERTLEEVLIGDPGKKENFVEDERQSFTSCKSANDTSAGNLSLANEENLELAKENIRKNIEEIFEDIKKKKYSKEILSIPSESVVFRDLLNTSETSDISEDSCSSSDKCCA